jgi:hypothetical protein
MCRKNPDFEMEKFFFAFFLLSKRELYLSPPKVFFCIFDQLALMTFSYSFSSTFYNYFDGSAFNGRGKRKAAEKGRTFS